MKKQLLTLVSSLFVLALSGCLASTTSSVAINCDYTQGKALWELPLVCQGGR